MSTTEAHRRATLAALFVTLLWSSSWVIMRVGMDDEELPPLTFAGLRYTAAAVVLGVVTVPGRAPAAELRALLAPTLRRLALLGVVFYAVNQGAVFVAVEAQPVATTSLVLSLTPLLVPPHRARCSASRRAATCCSAPSSCRSGLRRTSAATSARRRSA